jgi:hypothetical protein
MLHISTVFVSKPKHMSCAEAMSRMQITGPLDGAPSGAGSQRGTTRDPMDARRVSGPVASAADRPRTLSPE